ncbi:hypothetical protein LINPERPRIM_LOCUS11940, partial [Linum perenne]
YCSLGTVPPISFEPNQLAFPCFFNYPCSNFSFLISLLPFYDPVPGQLHSSYFFYPVARAVSSAFSIFFFFFFFFPIYGFRYFSYLLLLAFGFPISFVIRRHRWSSISTSHRLSQPHGVFSQQTQLQ